MKGGRKGEEEGEKECGEEGEEKMWGGGGEGG